MNRLSTPPQTPFGLDDLYRHFHVEELDCTPFGDLAACVIRSVDREQDGYSHKIWCFGLNGEPQARQLTQGPGRDTSPRWSPDGKTLAFLSDRCGTQQVYLLDRDGGEARQVSRLLGGVTSLQWSPDGNQLVVAAVVHVDPDARGGRQAELPGPRAANAPEVAWKLPYKSDGIGYLLSREMHLFAVDVASGEHRRITDGAFDVLAHAVSPDGSRLAYVRTRTGRVGHATDVWVCQLDGTGHMQVTDTHANVMQPVWSPDGTQVAFTGAVLEGDAESRLWVVDIAGGAPRQVGDVEVADPLSLCWQADGSVMVFVQAHRGRHQIAQISLDGELKVLLEKDIQIGAFDCTPRHFALSVHHPSQPSEVHVLDRDTEGAPALRQVSNLNAWWQERRAVVATSRIFKVPDGKGGEEEIEGWVLRSPDAQGATPLLNDIHGGPASYVQLDFDTNVYWQVLCSRGWTVLALNAVGSASFGREFCHRLEGHWGTHDLPQHLAAVKQLQEDGISSDCVAVCGKSYGGYLTAWATGHTDVFKAAIVMAPVGNIETHYGTSDGGYYADPFYMATAPRFDRERARDLSPLQYVERSETPTLFLQGKDDERTPRCQSEELFVSLLRAGNTPTEMVLYPGEGHGFLGEGAPACRHDAAQRIIRWLDTYCAPTGDAAPDAATGQK